MEKLKKTEFIILAILWVGSLTTYPVALLNNYNLLVSDFLGLAGLIVVSAFSMYKPKKALGSVLTLLLLGLFNILSFVYFINVVLTFGFSILVTPGIQLISLILLSVLLIKKRDNVREFYRVTFGQTEEEKEHVKQSSQNRFKIKFEKLSDNEIDFKINQGLVPEALEALKEIKKERENAIQQHL